MSYFTKESNLFLQDLMQNNNREWFQKNKTRYQEYLIKPIKELITNISDYMSTIDTDFVLEPRVDKTISRINRDTRFSKDKSPYKTNIWFTIKKRSEDWKNKPAFFFEIDPVGYTYGMGLFMASPKTMKRIREFIDNNTESFNDFLKTLKYKDKFKTNGEDYKRIKTDHNKEIKEFYLKKNIYFSKSLSSAEGLYNPDLYKNLINDFKLLVPLYTELDLILC